MAGVERPSFASRFRAALEAKPELTKYRLAQLSGVNESQIGKIERGKSLPSEETLLKLAPHMGVDLPELLAWAAEERFVLAAAKDPQFQEDLADAIRESARERIESRLRLIGELEEMEGDLLQGLEIMKDRGEADTEAANHMDSALTALRNALVTAKNHVASLEARIEAVDALKEAANETPEGADLRDKSRPLSRSAWAVPKGLKVEDDEKELMRQLEPADLLELGPAYVEEFWKRSKASRMETFRQWIADNAEAAGGEARGA